MKQPVNMPPRKRSRAPKGRDGRPGKEHGQQAGKTTDDDWRFRAESLELTRRLIEIHGKPERTSDPLNEYNITQGHHQV